jgi:hypothetical protein
MADEEQKNTEEEFNLLSRLSELYLRDKKFQDNIINFILKPILNDIRIRMQGVILVHALIMTIMMLILACILVILIVKIL